jgi:hypothetical protein
MVASIIPLFRYYYGDSIKKYFKPDAWELQADMVWDPELNAAVSPDDRRGEAIEVWTKSRPRTGARITAVLCPVCVAACGGKGSLLGSRVRPTAVKPMLGPKEQEKRVGEA